MRFDGADSNLARQCTRVARVNVRHALVMIALATASAGCSARPARIYAIDVDPGRLSKSVIEQCDQDGSGTLSDDELTALPPIADSRSKYDTDGNGQLSAEELKARFEEIFHPDVGVLPARCRVTHNGRPLAGAAVHFVPPEILADALPVASGRTESDGTASLRLAPEDMPKSITSTRAAVMRPGIYLVEVTHPTLQIPAEYNSQTTVGKEVFSEVLNGPPLPIDLDF